MKVENAWVCWSCHELFEQTPDAETRLVECYLCGGKLVRLLFLMHKHPPIAELDAKAMLEIERIYGRL